MPQISISHITTYRYSQATRFGPHRMMLRPREHCDLRLLAFDLETAPAASVVWSHDVAGNAVALGSFDAASDFLSIESRAVVDLTAPVWPVFAISASAISYPFRYSDDEQTDLGALARSQYLDEAGRFAAWVQSFVMGPRTDTLSLLKDVANGVTERVSYQSRESEGTQGPLETLDRGWGTCRDFAVLFAEAVRALGFGARLLSGYLYDPIGDRLGSTVAGSTHAWVEVFLPGAGWIPFDPTNRAVGSANLIPIAAARNIQQVAPVTGSFHGSKIDQLSMDVVVVVKTI